jgi:hypothetical protein
VGFVRDFFTIVLYDYSHGMALVSVVDHINSFGLKIIGAAGTREESITPRESEEGAEGDYFKFGLHLSKFKMKKNKCNS